MQIEVAKLRVGDVLKNRHLISPDRVRQLHFARDCASVGAGIMPNSRFHVAEAHARPGDVWVKLAIPGSHPPQSLKFTGGELAQLFEVVR